MLRESIDEGIVTPLCHVVEVLHANYLRDSLSLPELLGSDVADTDVTNQPLTLQFSKHRHWLLDRSLRWLHDATDAQVHHVQPIHTKISKVVVNSVDQFLAGEGMKPRFVLAAAGSNFGNNHQVGRVGMKSPLDNLIGYMRTVIVARVDVVHARSNRLSQDGHGCVNVARRPPDPGAGKLHGAVAHSVHVG